MPPATETGALTNLGLPSSSSLLHQQYSDICEHTRGGYCTADQDFYVLLLLHLIHFTLRSGTITRFTSIWLSSRMYINVNKVSISLNNFFPRTALFIFTDHIHCFHAQITAEFRMTPSGHRDSVYLHLKNTLTLS